MMKIMHHEYANVCKQMLPII